MMAPNHDIIDGILCPAIPSRQVSPVNTENGLEVNRHAEDIGVSVYMYV